MSILNFDYINEISTDLYSSLKNRSSNDPRIVEIEELQTKSGLPNLRVTHSTGKVTHETLRLIKQ